MYLPTGPSAGRPKKMSPREIAKMKKNMQKVPIIQEKAQAIQAVEAEAAESKLKTVLESGHLDNEHIVEVQSQTEKLNNT